MRNKLIGLDKRCDVRIIVPPPDLVGIAAERTAGMVRYFQTSVQHIQWWTVDKHLCGLAQSAYMQGLRDGIDAAVTIGEARP